MRAALGFAATTLAPLGYAAALSFGLPFVLALGAARRLTLPWVVGASTGVAAAVSAAVLAAIPACVGEDDCLAPWRVGAAVGGLLGAGVSALYCVVTGIRCRAAPPSPPDAAPRPLEAPARPVSG